MKKIMYCMAFAAMFAFASCGGSKAETTEEKVEDAVEQVAEDAKAVVEEAAEKVEATAEKVEEKVEEATNVAENESLLEAYEKLVKSAEELKASSSKKDVLGAAAKLVEVKKNADNVNSKLKEAKSTFTADQKAKYEELEARLKEAFK